MRKFIITSDGHFRYGDVNMHKDLLRTDDHCIGGGMYDFDYINSRMLLYGKSYDYGRPKWTALDTLFIPAALSGLTLIYDDIPLTDFPLQIKYL